MSVTVLRGERTIGGTLIVVEHDGARLLFDCGLPYDPATDPFAHVHRRPHRLLHDLLTLGILPLVPGLYDEHLLANGNVAVTDALPPVDGPLAVALSHSHLDHSHLVGFVDSAVPIYASAPTARIARLQCETGVSLAQRAHSIVETGPYDRFEVGAIRAHFVPVDHDVAGACGLIIETPDGVIAYSGDLRLHGLHPMRTLAFARDVREAGAELLILEGTRLFPAPDFPSGPSYERVEADVAAAVLRALEPRTGQLGIILLTPENGERVEALARAVETSGRLLVLDPGSLAFTTAALGHTLAAPHAVYIPDALARSMADGIEPPASIREAIADAPRSVSAEELRATPGRFLLRLPFDRFADLLSIVPPDGGGTIISANGLPLGPFEPAWTHLEGWARFFGMEIVNCSSSGHATAHDLALIAAHSGAPTIMSLHSLHPELMPIPPDRLLLPERGRRYELSGLRTR